MIGIISEKDVTKILQALVFNPYLTNGFSHRYQLRESTFSLGVLGVILKFYSIFR